MALIASEHGFSTILGVCQLISLHLHPYWEFGCTRCTRCGLHLNTMVSNTAKHFAAYYSSAGSVPCVSG